MGIKDNFSQAVKELWKKDGQGGENKGENKNAPGTTELEKYLQQNNGEPQANEQPMQQAGGVPLETPYYPTPEQQAAASQAAAARAAEVSAAQQQFEQRNAGQQTYDQNAAQGQPYDRGTAQEQPYNRNAANAQNMNRGAGQSDQGYSGMGSERPSDYNQGFSNGGYGTGVPGNYNVNRSMGGGNVPPSAGGAMAPQSGNETDELTVISKNTVIDGNVNSLANMRIDGNIKGNVQTTRDVDMSGKVIGDITCNNAGMNSAAMQGNVLLKGRMRMDRDTILIGDLSSQQADINGRIRGKLDIVGKAELKRDAIVFGDINASTLSVIEGAIVQGYVNTTFLSKDDSRNVFPEAISLDSKENQNNG